MCPAQPSLARATRPTRLGLTKAGGGQTPCKPNKSSPKLLLGHKEDRYEAQLALLQGEGERKKCKKEKKEQCYTVYRSLTLFFFIRSLIRALKLCNGHFTEHDHKLPNLKTHDRSDL